MRLPRKTAKNAKFTFFHCCGVSAGLMHPVDACFHAPILRAISVYDGCCSVPASLSLCLAAREGAAERTAQLLMLQVALCNALAKGGRILCHSPLEFELAQCCW